MSSADNFAAAFETNFARLQVAVLDACERERDWPTKVAIGVRAGLEFATAEPDAVQTLTNEALANGADGITRYERLVAYLMDRLRLGRDEQPTGGRLPEIAERALAGGVLTLVAQRVDQGRAAELPGLAPEAIQFVLTPYLGAEEARRIGAEYS